MCRKPTKQLFNKDGLYLTFEFCAAFLSLIVYATVTGRLIANLQMWLFFIYVDLLMKMYTLKGISTTCSFNHLKSVWIKCWHLKTVFFLFQRWQFWNVRQNDETRENDLYLLTIVCLTFRCMKANIIYAKVWPCQYTVVVKSVALFNKGELFYLHLCDQLPRFTLW